MNLYAWLLMMHQPSSIAGLVLAVACYAGLLAVILLWCAWAPVGPKCLICGLRKCEDAAACQLDLVAFRADMGGAPIASAIMHDGSYGDPQVVVCPFCKAGFPVKKI